MLRAAVGRRLRTTIAWKAHHRREPSIRAERALATPAALRATMPIIDELAARIDAMERLVATLAIARECCRRRPLSRN
jgi:hypothetical protein